MKSKCQNAACAKFVHWSILVGEILSHIIMKAYATWNVITVKRWNNDKHKIDWSKCSVAVVSMDLFVLFVSTFGSYDNLLDCVAWVIYETFKTDFACIIIASTILYIHHGCQESTKVV